MSIVTRQHTLGSVRPESHISDLLTGSHSRLSALMEVQIERGEWGRKGGSGSAEQMMRSCGQGSRGSARPVKGTTRPWLCYGRVVKERCGHEGREVQLWQNRGHAAVYERQDDAEGDQENYLMPSRVKVRCGCI